MLKSMRIGSYKLQEFPRCWYLALPKWWVESKGLNKGSQLDVFLNKEGNLEIRPIEVENEI